MSKILLTLLLSVLWLPSMSYAGIFSHPLEKIAMAEGGILLFDAAVPRIVVSVVEGKNAESAVGLIRKLSMTPKGREGIVNILSYYIITNENPIWANNAKILMSSAGVYDSNLDGKMHIVADNYWTHEKTLASIAAAHDAKKNPSIKCQGENNIYEPRLDFQPKSVHSPVKEYDFGSFNDLFNEEAYSDHLEHDHIPSVAAVMRFLEARDGKAKMNRKVGQGKIVADNASAFEVTEKHHATGRTFKWLNDASQQQLDASNLKVATIKDFAYYYSDVKTLDPRVIKAFLAIWERNTILCLYE